MKNKIITKRKNNIVILFVCLIFIFQAFPIVGCTSDNTDAGAGGGMYDEYILTEEDLAELNEAYFKMTILDDPNFADWDESALNELRKSPYNMFAQTVDIAMSRPSVKPPNGGRYYIGKYGECIVYCHLASDMSFLWPDFLLFVYYDTQFYTLDTALENGWISDSEMKKINDYCQQIDYYPSDQSN